MIKATTSFQIVRSRAIDSLREIKHFRACAGMY